VLEDLAWVRKKKDIEIEYEPKFAAYPLTGKKFYLGIKNTPHTVSFFLLPIQLWKDVSLGWWAEDIGLKWADINVTEKVAYYPCYSEYIFADNWLEIKETIFVPEDECAGVIKLNILNKSSETKILHLFVDATSNISYSPSGGTPFTPGTASWLAAEYLFSMVTPHEPQDPGYDMVKINENGILIANDSLKKKWTAVLGANIKPKNYYLAFFDRYYIRKGCLINLSVGNGVVWKKPRCCLEYHIKLKPNKPEKLIIVGAGSMNGEAEALGTFYRTLTKADKYFNEKILHYRKVADIFALKTPNSILNKMFTWSKCLIEALKYEVSGLGVGYLNAYPLWWEYFGRDVCVSLRGFIDAGDFKGAQDQFRQFVQFQFPSGEIPHELTPTGVVGWWDTDTTSLFLIAVDHYLKWTGDLPFIKEIYPSIKKAVSFLFALDTDGNLLLNNRGETSSFGTYGSKLGAELIIDQIYFAKALEGVANIAKCLGDFKNARKWAEAAKKVKDKIESLYWSEPHSFYGKEPGIFDEQSLASWAGMGVLYKVFKENRAEKVIERLERDDFAHDCGILMISRERKDFYHAPILWSWPTGLINYCEFMHHRLEQGIQHLINYASLGLQAYPGSVSDIASFADERRSAGCRIYSFAINSLLVPLIEGMLGFQPDMLKNELIIDPHIPYDWPNVEARNVKVGKYCLDLICERGNGFSKVSLILKNLGVINTRLGINLPAVVKVKRVLLNGKEITEKAEIKKNVNDIHVYSPLLSMKAPSKLTLQVEYEVLYPYFISSNYKILDPALNEQITDFVEIKYLATKITDKNSQINFYAPAGVKYELKFKSPSPNFKAKVNGEEASFKYDEKEKTLTLEVSTPHPISLSDTWKVREENTISLMGIWKCSEKPADEWYKTEYDDSAWKELELSENIPREKWRLLVVPPGRYLPDRYYRKIVKAPPWRDGRIFLYFNKIHAFGDLTVFVNGKEVYGPNIKKNVSPPDYTWHTNVNSHAVHIQALLLDVTEEFQPGAENLIAVKASPITDAKYVFQECWMFQGWPDLDYDDSAWKEIKRNETLSLKQKGYIWIRQKVKVPREYEGKRVRLKLYSPDQKLSTGSMWIFVNGQAIHWARGVHGKILQFYIHEYLKFSDENLIAIRIEGDKEAAIFGEAKLIPIWPIKVEFSNA